VRPHRRGLRIGLVIAAVLLLMELATRAGVMPGTADFDRYRAFPDEARELSAAAAPRVAFIGNSVTDRVRRRDFADEWRRATGTEPAVAKFIAYYSNLSTWSRMYAQYFWKQGVAPDLVVITVFDGNTFRDSPPLDVGNLALFFTGPEDRESLFENEITTLAERADYLLSSVSHAFAARDRIRVRVLNLIPGYRPFATENNALNFEYARRLAAAHPEPAAPPTFDGLAALLDHAREAGVTVCFVAFPMRPEPGGRRSYIISPTAIDMIHDAGMLFLDMRDSPWLTADMYSDNVHLNAKGQPIYTRMLARELSRKWTP
jgi:hypothetical protein